MALKIGDKVFLYHLKCFGIVKRVNSFGLAFAPTVQTADKKQYVFPGKNATNICDKIELFMEKQKDVVQWNAEEIDAFVNKWFTKTNLSTRQHLYDGLVLAINTGNNVTLIDYLNHVNNII